MQILLQKVPSELRHPGERPRAKDSEAYGCVGYWAGLLFLFPAAQPASRDRRARGRTCCRGSPLADRRPGVAGNLLCSEGSKHPGSSRSAGESQGAEQTRPRHYFHIRTFFPSLSFPAIFFFPFTFCQQTPSSNELLLVSHSFFSTFTIKALNFLGLVPASPTSHTHFLLLAGL